MLKEQSLTVFFFSNYLQEMATGNFQPQGGPKESSKLSDRYSYRAAIYQNDAVDDVGND